MIKINIQVKLNTIETKTTNLGITSTDADGESQVTHTKLTNVTVLAASHVTLYVQVRGQKGTSPERRSRFLFFSFFFPM